MGVIEKKGRKRARKRNLQEILLRSIAAAGIVGLAVVAPSMPAALHKLGLIPGRNDVGNISRARKKLLSDGCIFYEGPYTRLTDKGRRRLELIQAREILLEKSHHWDGRWRVLIFDIPEYRKHVRDKTRELIRSFGFEPLQKSVWIYPYPCEDLIVLLKAELKIGKDMLYMIVDELEMDGDLRKKFGLSLV
jgi:hypothetical protein